MKTSRLLLVMSFAFALACVSQGSTLSFNLPGINGEDATPGFPGAMKLYSISVSTSGFSIVKNVDKATPGLFQAVALGTHFPSGQFLMYNASVPSTPPDQSLRFTDLIDVAHTFQGINQLTEVDTFAEVTYRSLFLYLPGINGESNTPGFADVMQLQSFTIDPNQFSVVRTPDSATVQIDNAVILGKQFPMATLLLYSQANPSGQPDAILEFDNIAASAFSISGIVNLLETDTFAYASIPTPPPPSVPEPASWLFVLAGGIAIGEVGRRIRC